MLPNPAKLISYRQTTNPVQVTLIIGDDSGTVSVKATKLSEVAWLGRRRVP